MVSHVKFGFHYPFYPNTSSVLCNNTNMIYSEEDYSQAEYYLTFPSCTLPLFKPFYSRKPNTKKMNPRVCKIEKGEDFFSSFYSFLEGIMLPPRHLMEYGFPVESFVIGKAYFNAPRDENGPGPLNARICCRCRSEYNITDNDFENACVYHPQKLISVNSNDDSYQMYPCCNAVRGSKGCVFNSFHVSSSKCSMTDDFFSTSENDFIKKNIVVLDTEMCYTKKGMEITQVTLLSYDGSILYDAYVEPNLPIIDYNTQFSGITADTFENRKIPFEDARESLLKIINQDTIIIGHGLENDLKALRFIHKKIVDTSIIFPHRCGFPFRRSLKSLSEKYLKKCIQIDKHNSREDCKACLDLVMLKWNGSI